MEPTVEIDVSNYNNIMVLPKILPAGTFSNLYKFDLILRPIGNNQYYVIKNRHGSTGQTTIPADQIFLEMI